METIRGSITDIEEGIIIHQVNCRNRIGADVSNAIVTKWPQAEAEYHKLCESRQPEDLFGRRQTVEVCTLYGIQPELTVINLFSQVSYPMTKVKGLPQPCGCTV